MNIPFLRSPEVLTPEQEVRYQYLFSKIGRTQEEYNEISELSYMRGTSNSRPSWWPWEPNFVPSTFKFIPLSKPMIHARVIKGELYGDEYQWQIILRLGERGVSLPRIEVIREFIAPSEQPKLALKQRAYQDTGDYLTHALNRRALNPQLLADSLKAYLFARESSPNESEASTSVDADQARLLNEYPATLLIGGMAMRLVPVGKVDTRPLIAKVRERALAGAKKEGELVRTRAVFDAQVVVREAERKASIIHEKLEIEKAKVRVHPPEWLLHSNRPMLWKNEQWCVGLSIGVKVKSIRLLVQRWKRVLYWDSIVPTGRDEGEYFRNFRLAVWLPIGKEGEFTIRSAFTSRESVTHLDSVGTCMGLEGLPSKVNSEDEAKLVETALTRGMEVVNLNSPLNTRTLNYYPYFLEQLPAAVVKIIRGDSLRWDDRSSSERAWVEAHPEMYEKLKWSRSESLAEEASGVFSVEGLGRVAREAQLRHDLAQVQTPQEAEAYAARLVQATPLRLDS